MFQIVIKMPPDGPELHCLGIPRAELAKLAKGEPSFTGLTRHVIPGPIALFAADSQEELLEAAEAAGLNVALVLDPDGTEAT